MLYDSAGLSIRGKKTTLCIPVMISLAKQAGWDQAYSGQLILTLAWLGSSRCGGSHAYTHAQYIHMRPDALYGTEKQTIGGGGSADG